MPSINRVILAGNLTRDPDTKEVGTGRQLCKFSLAINKKYKDQAGQLQSKVTYVDVSAWGDLALNCQKFLGKGAGAIVEGALELREWSDKTSGEKRSKLEVVAAQVHFLTHKGDAPAASGTPTDAPPPMSDDDIPF